jgi:hypothetical protein
MSFEKRWIVTKNKYSNQERKEAKIGGRESIREKINPNKANIYNKEELKDQVVSFASQIPVNKRDESQSKCHPVYEVRWMHG